MCQREWQENKQKHKLDKGQGVIWITTWLNHFWAFGQKICSWLRRFWVWVPVTLAFPMNKQRGFHLERLFKPALMTMMRWISGNMRDGFIQHPPAYMYGSYDL